MDSFLKCVFVRAGKHTSVHDVHPHSKNGNTSLVSAFREEEYRKCIAALKNNKAAGIDDILGEQLKNLGPKAHKSLHTCFIENKIPKI